MYNLSRKRGPVAQLGARLNGIEKVKGSSPFRSIAQLNRDADWHLGDDRK